MSNSQKQIMKELLENTGEYDRIKEKVKDRLKECGWVNFCFLIYFWLKFFWKFNNVFLRCTIVFEIRVPKLTWDVCVETVSKLTLKFGAPWIVRTIKCINSTKFSKIWKFVSLKKFHAHQKIVIFKNPQAGTATLKKNAWRKFKARDHSKSILKVLLLKLLLWDGRRCPIKWNLN